MFMEQEKEKITKTMEGNRQYYGYEYENYPLGCVMPLYESRSQSLEGTKELNMRLAGWTGTVCHSSTIWTDELLLFSSLNEDPQEGVGRLILNVVRVDCDVDHHPASALEVRETSGRACDGPVRDSAIVMEHFHLP